MKSLLPSHKQYTYESSVTRESRLYPGVRYRIARMSFGRRCELARMVRELSQRLEFHNAGASLRDKAEASLLATEINSLYVRWGLLGIEGLLIDGCETTPEKLVQTGPEDLSREIVGAIQAECGLSEEERKN